MKFFSVFFVLAIAIITWTGNPNHDLGTYNTWTHELRCEGRPCYHEVAHLADQQGGWISRGDEFKKQIADSKIVWYGINYPRYRSCTVDSIFNCIFGWGGYTEYYAYLLYEANGCVRDLPDQFQGFYDKKLIDQKLNEIGFPSQCKQAVFRYMSKLTAIVLPNDQIVPVIDVLEIPSELPPQLRVPLVDDLFGINLYNPAPLVIAHDYLAGDHIDALKEGDELTFVYIDGVMVSYTIKEDVDVASDAVAYDTYTMRYCIYFQTCEEDGRIVKLACR
jgi:hypothetical protein